MDILEIGCGRVQDLSDLIQGPVAASSKKYNKPWVFKIAWNSLTYLGNSQLLKGGILSMESVNLLFC